MKNKECDTVKDLLPLYVDDSCSDNSKEMIERHLSECPECSKLYDLMKQPIAVSTDDENISIREIEPMKKIKKRQTQMVVWCLMFAVFVFVIVIGIAEDLGFQILKNPKYVKLSKEIAKTTQEYIGNSSVEDYVETLDPIPMYEHDCNDLEWTAKLYADKVFPHTIDIDGVEFAVTDNYYKFTITAEKPSTQAGLDYQEGNIYQFLQDEWDHSGTLILPQKLYEKIEDKKTDKTVSFECNGTLYYYNGYIDNSSKDDLEITIQSHLMSSIKRQQNEEGKYILSKLQQAAYSSNLIPMEVYNEFRKESAEVLSYVQNIEKHYIDMSFEGYKELYKEKLIDFFSLYIAEHGTPVKSSVNSIWYVSGSGDYHCYIKLAFADGDYLLLNYAMNNSGSYYIYTITEYK